MISDGKDDGTSSGYGSLGKVVDTFSHTNRFWRERASGANWSAVDASRDVIGRITQQGRSHWSMERSKRNIRHSNRPRNIILWCAELQESVVPERLRETVSRAVIGGWVVGVYACATRRRQTGRVHSADATTDVTLLADHHGITFYSLFFLPRGGGASLGGSWIYLA